MIRPVRAMGVLANPVPAAGATGWRSPERLLAETFRYAADAGHCWDGACRPLITLPPAGGYFNAMPGARARCRGEVLIYGILARLRNNVPTWAKRRGK